MKITLTAISVKSIYIYLLSSVVALVSFIIGPLYLNGDQTYYRESYEGLKNLNIFEGYVFYSGKLDSLEFVHYILSWLASKVIEKDTFVVLSNTALAFLTLKLLKKWNVSIIVAGLIVITNFYIIILYFSAERLKYGFMFLILSFLLIENKRLFYLFALVSILTHVQMLLIYGSIYFCFFLKKIKHMQIRKIISSTDLYAIILAVIILIATSSQITNKFNAYYAIHGFDDILRILLFFILSLWYTKDRLEATFIFIPIILAVFFLGGDRVNIFGYFIFLYYALRVKRGLNAGVALTSIYFLYTSYIFIYSVYNYGDGFYFNYIK